MSNFALSVESLFDGHEIKRHHTITVENGVIAKLEKRSESDDLHSGLLTAGYIDTQVNGGGGFLFNQSPDLETICSIGRTHQTYGTTGWLPTLVTDTLDQMERAANAVAAARSIPESGVLGIHFEGPHLSTEKKGVHPERFIRKMTDSELNLFSRADLGKVVVTLAPENVAPECISELVNSGVIVSLGHSNASFEQTRLALAAGATGFTHLFNAMSAFTSREPGMVGAALLDETSYCGLIMDGVHVHPATAKIAINTKKNMMLVTDAMSPVGTEQTTFELFGESIVRNNNVLRDSHGRLAGSVLDMSTAVNNCSSMLELDKVRALKMATLNPAKFLGLDNQYGSLEIGKKASMILIDEDGKVLSSWIDGIQIF